MKFLKWLLIVLIVLAGLVLIVPLFLPSEITLSVEKNIDTPPELLFDMTASYADRVAWDPWLTKEPGAKVDITTKEGYVGSGYTWEGEELGTGRMLVDSVSAPGYIRSLIWFGDMPDPNIIEWKFKALGNGTQVTWSFTSEGNYPFGRFMLQMMKKPLLKDFNQGLQNLSDFLDENPLPLYRLSKISIEKSYDTEAMVVAVSGTMDVIGAAMQSRFPELAMEIQKQGLEMNGPAFAHYLDYDEESGVSNVLLAMPVKSRGKAAGDIKPRFYKAVEAVTATHIGQYQYFNESYESLQKYIDENHLEVTGEAYEVYITNMMTSQNPMDWRTMIAFPLKQ